MYNDYMILPPENKREPHVPVSSFNVYGKNVESYKQNNTLKR